MDNTELQHWGILGMKWGRRRYQNADGTLTEEGKRRRTIATRDMKPSNKEKYKAEEHIDEWVNQDIDSAGKIAREGANVSRTIKDAVDRSNKPKKQSRLDLSEMSDKELRDKINRELLERQYNDVFNPPTVNKGKEVAGKILDGVGTTLTLAGSAAMLAISIRQLAGKG